MLSDMAKAQYHTVAEYLNALPDDRREAIEAVRAVINANLDPVVEEGIQYNMIGWFVPHSVYPKGYHCDPQQPVPFVSLASQKNHMAVYLFCLYCDPTAVDRFTATWKASGKRLDMGKSCVRFNKLEGVCLEAIGDAVAEMTVERFIAAYESNLTGPSGGFAKHATTPDARGTKPAAKRNTTKTAAAGSKAATKSARESSKASADKITRKTTKKAGKKASKKPAK